MKEIKDISIEELEAIAGDKSIAVPKDLASDISADLNALELLGESGKSTRRLIYFSSIAASLLLLVGTGLGLKDVNQRPKDTYEDPYLAYAQLEKTMDLISAKMMAVSEATLGNDVDRYDDNNE